MTRLVVTGTDTGIGKTIFSAALVQATDTPYWKPIQSGLEEETDSETVARLAGVPKLFEGEHTFEIETLGPNRVRFLHSERFAGVLVPFLRKMLETKTRAGFEAMNRALKERAEAPATA